MTTTIRRWLLPLMLVLSLVLAACGGEGDDTTEEEPVTEPAEEPADEPAEEPADDEEAEAEEPASEEPAEEAAGFYEGKDLELLVPLNPGGGTDLTARFLATYLDDLVAGEPNVQVVNEPGGGGVTAANDWYNSDQSAGESGLMVGGSTGGAWLTGEQTVEYDIAALEPIILFPSSRIFFVRTDLGLETVEDVANYDGELSICGQQPGGSGSYGLIGLEVLGLGEEHPAIRHVWGYGSGGDVNIATEQGECDGFFLAPLAMINYYETPEILRETLTPVLSLGLPDGQGGYERDEAFPEAPTVPEAYEMLHGEEISQAEGWESAQVWIEHAGSMSFGLWMHPEAPQEAIQALRDAMERAADDEEFLATAEEQLGPYDPITGDELSVVSEFLSGLEPGQMNWGRERLMEVYDVPDLRLD